MNNNLANSAGLVSFNILNVNTLYIEGVLFEGGGTGGLQAQIDAIDATLNNDILPITNRIDLTGLTGNLVITDANKNSVLKTAIDNINTQIAGFNKFDLTGLTGVGSCVITNATTNQALNGLISTNTSAIATHTSQIASNTTAIGINTSNIASNTSNIATNTSNISTNTSNIATNTSAISSINSQITSINNSITAINAKLANFSVWNVGGTTMSGIRNNTGFAIDHSADDSSNGLFVYPNGDAHNAQVRIETAQDKQLYMRGGGAVAIYAGANGTILNRNTILIGDETDHIQIGSFSGAVKFPLIYIGTSGAGLIPSQTQMRGSWFFNNFTTSIYDGVLSASGANQLITAKTSLFLSGLNVVAPVDLVNISAIVGGITLNAGAGILALNVGVGSISMSCAGGAVSINTGGGAMSINLGAGVLNMASGTGNSNWTTINGNLYLGAGKGTGGSAGSIQLRAVGTISISPDTNTEIDKTSYVEMKDGSAPATTTRKLYHTGGQLWYDGTQLSNQTNVKSLVAGTGISLSNASGAWTITATATTPTLSQVLYAGNTANVPIYMNNNDITGVKDIVGVNCNFNGNSYFYNIVPNFISGWNVKSLVAGGGINLVNNFGAWTISATATTPSLSQVLAVGSVGNEMTLTTANITTGNFNTINTYNITGWNVKELTAGSGVAITNTSGNYTISASGGGGGETNFILQNTTSVVNTNPVNSMTTTYTSTAGTTITRNAYTANVEYAMGKFKSGYLLGSANLILSGIYTADLYGLLTSNQPSYLYSKFFHIAERSSPTTEFLIDKSLTYTTIVDTFTSTYLRGSPIIIPVVSNGLSSIVVYSISFPEVRIVCSPNNTYIRFSMLNQAGTGLFSVPDILITSADSTATRTFNLETTSFAFTSATSSYSFQMDVYSTNGTTPILSQPKKRSNNDCVYQLNATIKHLMYDGTSNKTLLTNGLNTIYQLSIPFPFSAYDISVFTNYSKIQYEPFFIQPSGSTTGHSMVLSFQDGALSHLTTSISTSTATTPTLSQVLTAGATASTNINMNGFTISGGDAVNCNGSMTATNMSCSQMSYTTLFPFRLNPSCRYFYYLTGLGYNNYVNLPTDMDLFKYDYELDFKIDDLPTTQWCYLDFNGGIGSWNSTLFFNYLGSGAGSPNTSAGFYTSALHPAYWFNGGQVSSGSRNVMFRGKYRISAYSPTQFVVYYMGTQPVSMIQGTTTYGTYYLVYATQICYNYSSNDATRYAPYNLRVNCAVPYGAGSIMMTQCLKTSNYF